MDLYRLRLTGELKTDADLRGLHPNSVLPFRITPDVADELGADPVLEGPKPSYEPGKTLRAGPVVQDELGNWIQTYLSI